MIYANLNLLNLPSHKLFGQNSKLNFIRQIISYGSAAVVASKTIYISQLQGIVELEFAHFPQQVTC